MPTDMPSEPRRRLTASVDRFLLFIADARIAFSFREMQRARQRYDHRGLLRSLDALESLHRRRGMLQRWSTIPAITSAGNIREILRYIHHERRRLTWTDARIRRARVARDLRALRRAERLQHFAHMRLRWLWAHL
jgi:hypothetical protein